MDWSKTGHRVVNEGTKSGQRVLVNELSKNGEGVVITWSNNVQRNVKESLPKFYFLFSLFLLGALLLLPLFVVVCTSNSCNEATRIHLIMMLSIATHARIETVTILVYLYSARKSVERNRYCHS